MGATQLTLIVVGGIAVASCAASPTALSTASGTQVTARPDERPSERATPSKQSSREVREKSLAYLSDRGFRPAPTLPLSEMGEPRPSAEVAGRFVALFLTITWVGVSEEKASSNAIKKWAGSPRIARFLTPDDQAILDLTREAARSAHGPTIGWRLENLGPLAWSLGMPEPPSPLAPAATFGETESMAELLEMDVHQWMEDASLRPVSEIRQMEDIFYCAHNAVRSAQLGVSDVVPPGFDPISDGGLVHERRHSLTWILSPGTTWDDTPLDT